MGAICEVIGWLLEDDRSKVLIREENGAVSSQCADLQTTFGQQAIQTGAFRRGNPIIDPVTRKMVGYEMQQVERTSELGIA